MFVECQPDGVDGAADVILVGTHPETGDDSLLVVELKRWSSVGRTDDPEKVDVSGFSKPKHHPSTQVRRVMDYFNGDGRQPGIAYAGLSYLHNATDASIEPLLDAGTRRGAHALYFTADTRQDLLEELDGRFRRESGTSAAERLLTRLGLRNAPLLEAVALSDGADTAFTLRGMQKTVWRDVKRAVSRFRNGSAGTSERAVFLVRGGAGTGKSAIGLQLLRHFTDLGLRTRYATGSRAFDASLREFIARDDLLVQEQLAYFMNFVEPPVPPLDLLICDEAHRLRAESTLQFWAAEKRGKQPQVDELIQAAQVTVFLLDDDQSLRKNEVGSSALICEAAERNGVTAQIYDLHTEFRCGGSDTYRAWVLDLLGISGRKPGEWAPDGLMHVEVAESAEQLERIVRMEEQDGATARMVAGFCWPWSEPHPETRVLHRDVRIGDWHRPWNAKGPFSRHTDGEPPAKLWGVKREGIGQVGCVYTAQGLEWDWCGVIMGDDMVWREGGWVFRKGKTSGADEETGERKPLKPGSMDPGLPADADEFARCVRNAYHVLLTRASRATVIHSTDGPTQEYLRTLVGPVDDQGLRPAWASLTPEEQLRRSLRAHDARRGRKQPPGQGIQPDLFGF
ncbi:DUF2075 domain-containing protein [Streptomyces sp. TBY4]|uniref:DUF2075 domain-containing protein n=1 Tax=Streptomyces sp. TBY4 TaxID=2962030 RepID=UPI0020B82569|nr:DUF2075 domain-containing protein [Streptomyces sp. TBY4]MCP3754101.1 DUF2075 domain-containing protein [Streptomyces sp. TBY4]